MENFKIWVSKQNKNFTFVLTAENEQLAKNRIHKEWYSILSIEKISDMSNIWNKYFFEAEKDWEIKNWKIIWEDIFKIYLKLRKKLWYKIFKLYDEKEKNISENDKLKLIKELEAQYNIYIKSFKKKKNNTSLEKKLKEQKVNTKNSIDTDNFYLKKNLEETYKLINFILIKLKNIIDWKEINNLSEEEKTNLKNIHNWILKIKSTTNILKLKDIWEKALLKIWLLELKFLETKKTTKSKNLLKETNLLLKQIWSNKSIIEKKYNISYYIWIIKSNFEKIFSKKKKVKQQVDKNSYNYLKNQLLLNKYKEKLKSNRKQIFKNLFNNKKRETFILKDKVINQNILLLKVKQKWTNFSYTFIKKWYKDLFKKILIWLDNFRFLLLFSIIFYTLFFIVFYNFNFYLNIEYFNFVWIKYILFIIFLYYLIFFSKNFYLIIINSIFSYFIIMFFIINF